MKILYWLGGIVLLLVVLFFAMRLYFVYLGNPNVMEELRTGPEGERAQIVAWYRGVMN